MPALETRFWSKVNKNGAGGCWLWTAGCTKDGYGQIRVGGTPGKVEYAHRVAWELLNGQIPEGLCVLHKCDSPPCVNLEHLFLGTDNDNVQDKMAKGRYVLGVHPGRPGEKNPLHILTEKQVLEIKQALADDHYGLTAELAQKYGVAYHTIYDVKTEVTWKWLKLV